MAETKWEDEDDSTHTLTVVSLDWKPLLVSSAKLSAVATASRATAAALRAIGGPVAETIAARADETARLSSEAALVAVAEAAALWVGLGTGDER